MEKYILYYGLLDDEEMKESFGEFENEEEATDAAYKLACAEYDSRPVRTVEQIMDEDDCGEEEAVENYELERDDNIDWFSEPEDEELEEEDEEEEWDEDPFDEDDE